MLLNALPQSQTWGLFIWNLCRRLSVSPSLVLSFSHPPHGSTMDEMRTGDPGREKKRTFHFYLLQARRTGEEMATSEGHPRGPTAPAYRGGGGVVGRFGNNKKWRELGGGRRRNSWLIAPRLLN